MRALFVTYGGGHIAMVLPVIEALSARGIDSRLIALTTGGRRARQAGLDPMGYADFLHLVDREAVLAHGRRLSEGNQHPDVDALESESYLGINFSEWVDTYGHEEATRLMESVGRRGFFPIRFMGRVIDELQPDVVVATNSPRSEQAVVEAAVARGIPTLSMVDLFALDYDPYLKRKVHADRITVLGPQVRDKLVAAGVPAGRVRVTGNPIFDALVSPEHQAQARALRESLGWTRRMVVLWAGHLEGGPDTPPHWRDEKFGVMVESLLRDWVASREDVALIVRYHPNEYQAFPTRPPQPGVYVSDPRSEPVHTALLAADAVVVQTTTVGVEAAVAGRNVFALSFSPLVRSSGLDYSLLGLAHGVPSPQDLVPMLERYAGQPVAGAGRFNAGHAAQAVAAEIAALMPAVPRPVPSRA
jgi:hypothetical protein